jgi:SAM-dependent methyltransferase
MLAPEEKHLSEWHENYVKNHKLRIAIDLDMVKKQGGQGSGVLEFGSVPLLLTAALSASNYNVTGIDLAPERYRGTIEKIGIKVVKCDIETEKLPFGDNSFDAVVFNELFEHLRINPIFTLSEVLRVLRPGGIMMLSSPNLRSLNGMYNFCIKNRAYSCSGNTYEEYQKLENLGHMGHVREYTTAEVTEFLTNIGFDVTSIIYRGRFRTIVKQLLARAFPGLRPFVSYVSKKPK